eukprot:6124049-Pyramimonas_sp.AAC.5
MRPVFMYAVPEVADPLRTPSGPHPDPIWTPSGPHPDPIRTPSGPPLNPYGLECRRTRGVKP